jgi:hypothetical protein
LQARLSAFSRSAGHENARHPAEPQGVLTLFAMNELLPGRKPAGKNGNIFIPTLENGRQVC